MAKSSKKQQAPDNKQTRKQIALGRKQARQNRIIYLSIAALVAVILIILAAGLITEVLIKPSQPVAKVGGDSVRTDDFQNLLTYLRYNQHLNILNLENSMQEISSDDEGADFLLSFYEQQLAQLQSTLALAPQNALDELIEDVLIKEEAEKLGITVTDADVTQTINDDLRQAVAPAPQTSITDTEELPAPTPIPQEQLDEILNSALASMGLTEKQFRNIVARRMLREQVQEVKSGEVVTTGLVSHVQLIQTDTQAQAEAAKARIDAGEDFGVVAQEVSTDTISAADGGDLGWVAEDQLTFRYGQEVEDAAFSSEVGKLTMVQSGDNHFVILVLERDPNGPLPDQVLGPLQDAALSTWLEEQKASREAEIERLLDADQIPPDPFATPVPAF